MAVNAYDAYGIPNTTNLGRFQYTGQIWIPELGLYHYKARAYSPTLGRFLQTDPIGYEDQYNLYAYTGNDPVNARDPSGKTIEYSGDPEQQKSLRDAVESVANSTVEFKLRHAELESSERTIIISPTNGESSVQPISDPQNLGAPFDFSKVKGPVELGENTTNGVGTSSLASINLSGTVLAGAGPGGTDLAATASDLAAHEVFEHAYKNMIGASPIGNDSNGTPLSEVEAVRTENKFRATIPGAPLRQKY